MKMTSEEKATAKRVCAHITLNRKFDLGNVEDGGVSFGFAFILGKGRFLLACSSGHYHLVITTCDTKAPRKISCFMNLPVCDIGVTRNKRSRTQAKAYLYACRGKGGEVCQWRREEPRKQPGCKRRESATQQFSQRYSACVNVSRRSAFEECLRPGLLTEQAWWTLNKNTEFLSIL